MDVLQYWWFLQLEYHKVCKVFDLSCGCCTSPSRCGTMSEPRYVAAALELILQILEREHSSSRAELAAVQQLGAEMCWRRSISAKNQCIDIKCNQLTQRNSNTFKKCLHFSCDPEFCLIDSFILVYYLPHIFPPSSHAFSL